MKKILVVALAILAGSVLAEEPDQAFDTMIDAMYQGDAQGLMDCLSTESLGLIDFVLMMLKMEPEESIAEISSELGFDITVEDINGWTSADLVEVVITAQVFVDELPPREELASDGFEIRGDSSTVFVDYGSSPPLQILMVKEGESWKLDQSEIGSYMM